MAKPLWKTRNNGWKELGDSSIGRSIVMIKNEEEWIVEFFEWMPYASFWDSIKEEKYKTEKEAINKAEEFVNGKKNDSMLLPYIL